VTILSIDFETRSAVDLTKTGVYRYAEDPSTDILCMSWAFDDEEPTTWLPSHAVLPARIEQHIRTGGEIRAWNAQFERVMWNYVMRDRYCLPHVRREQWVCSAAEAAAMALPRSLGAAAAALGVAAQKDKEGHALMMRMCKPRKRNADGTFVWWDAPELLERLIAYCEQDVRTERAIVPRLRRLPTMERELYLLDQAINDRGLGVDVPLIRAAQRIAERGVEQANAVLSEATQGRVDRVTQNAKLLDWLRERGHDVDSVAKASVLDLLAQELTPEVRRALIARQEGGLSSIAKLESMLEARCTDDRVRGLLLYHGATTGRWSGRVVQPHNFPRGTIDDPERFIPLILEEDYDRIDIEENPIAVVSSLLRGMLVPDPSAVLIAGDYSAIEARVVNWLSGQEDILQLFREGKDVYKYNGARLYKIPLEEVQKFPHRQTGKFQELGCGFQMGAKRAVDAARDVYGLTITLKEAKEIVSSYRETHTEVVRFWNETNEACKQAIRVPNAPVRFGAQERLLAVKTGGYLLIRLPSGRFLSYPAPRIVKAEAPWSKEARADWALRKTEAELAGEEFLEEEPEVQEVDNIEFSAQLKNSKWGRERTYGGKLVENITQAVARDIMAEAMLRLERHGFNPVLTVHDEVVGEVVLSRWDLDEAEEEFARLLAQTPDWATGCPVAVETWVHNRYKK
jgi:DNA polymerase